MNRVAAAEMLGDEHLDLLAQQLFARVAEYIFGLCVHHNDLALSAGGTIISPVNITTSNRDETSIDVEGTTIERRDAIPSGDITPGTQIAL